MFSDMRKAQWKNSMFVYIYVCIHVCVCGVGIREYTCERERVHVSRIFTYLLTKANRPPCFSAFLEVGNCKRQGY